MRYTLPLIVLVFTFGCVRAQDDVNEATAKSMKEAAAKAAPWVVKIDTSGGRDMAGGAGGGPPGSGPPAVRKGVGPTSGLVIDKDGYVITSAFNFANKPTDIFVTVPGKERKVAKVVANDTSRMLTLLKVELKDLAVPEVYPAKDLKVGQWSLAMGRALEPELVKVPGYSRGIVSALGRIYGKCIQTDAKVSPINYGGPLIAIDGRVMGVLTPASTRGDGETAGVEWYDSGIGFAVPLEDILRVFPRLKGGKDIGRGMLGFNPKDPTEMYNVPIVIGSIAADSAAQKLNLKVGDTITGIDDRKINNYSELMHALGPKYEGDTIDLVILRDGKEKKFPKVVLGTANQAFAQPFFGILPMRDDPDAGVEVRYVYPKSPAATAGLKEGDRIMKIGVSIPNAPPGAGNLMPIVGGKAQLAQIVGGTPVGMDLKIEVKRKEGDKTNQLVVKIGALTEEMPEKLPMPSTKGRALEKPKLPAGAPKPPMEEEPVKPKDGKEDKKDEKDDGPEKSLLTGKVNKTNGREYWMYVPDNYDRNKSYGVIIWLHGAQRGNNEPKEMKKIWEDYCDSANFIILAPKSKTGNWNATETEDVVLTVNEVLKPYTVDRKRVIVHGSGLGGQMGLYMSFSARDTVRGAAVSSAALTSPPKDNLPNQPLSFFLIAGDKDPLLVQIKESNEKLREKKFPVMYREIKDFGKQYIDQTTLNELVIWLDTMDRI